MSRTRLYLMLFGIISVMLMSSVMIRRTFVGAKDSLDTNERIKKLNTVSESVQRMAMLLQESVVRSTLYLEDSNDRENADKLIALIGDDYDRLKTHLRQGGIHIDSTQIAMLMKSLASADKIITIEEKWLLPGLRDSLPDAKHNVKRDTMAVHISLLVLDAREQLDRVQLEIRSEASKYDVGEAQRVFLRSAILICLAVLMFLAGLIGLIILLGSPAWKNRRTG